MLHGGPRQPNAVCRTSQGKMSKAGALGLALLPQNDATMSHCWETLPKVCPKPSSPVAMNCPRASHPVSPLCSDHSRRHEVEDEMTQTEWSYSEEPLAAGEDGEFI